MTNFVEQEVSNMGVKVEREVKSINDKISVVKDFADIVSQTTNDKIAILTDKVEHKISVMVEEVGTESRKEISLLADKINHKMEATNISVLVMADKLEQEKQ